MARPKQHQPHLAHGSRRLTPAELERLDGFPDAGPWDVRRKGTDGVDAAADPSPSPEQLDHRRDDPIAKKTRPESAQMAMATLITAPMTMMILAPTAPARDDVGSTRA